MQIDHWTMKYLIQCIEMLFIYNIVQELYWLIIFSFRHQAIRKYITLRISFLTEIYKISISTWSMYFIFLYFYYFSLKRWLQHWVQPWKARFGSLQPALLWLWVEIQYSHSTISNDNGIERVGEWMGGCIDGLVGRWVCELVGCFWVGWLLFVGYGCG